MEPTRRELIQILSALAVRGGATATVGSQRPERLTISDLRGAHALQHQVVDSDRLDMLRRAVEQSLGEFARVRSLDVSDDVGLPTVFRPTAARDR